MTDPFLEWWSICPRKVGKKAAEKKYWIVRREVAHETLCAAMERYAQYHKAKGTAVDYIKHPTTWLNGGCWEDETPDAPARIADSNTTRPCPQYLRRSISREHETAEQRRHKQLRADAHEVMRKRGHEPMLMPDDQYKPMLADIMRELEARAHV